jgi:DNA-binding transcriptional regulator LsrR (DeoR family)
MPQSNPLSLEQIKEIARLYFVEKVKQADIAKIMNRSQSTISYAVRMTKRDRKRNKGSVKVAVETIRKPKARSGGVVYTIEEIRKRYEKEKKLEEKQKQKD